MLWYRAKVYCELEGLCTASLDGSQGPAVSHPVFTRGRLLLEAEPVLYLVLFRNPSRCCIAARIVR